MIDCVLEMRAGMVRIASMLLSLLTFSVYAGGSISDIKVFSGYPWKAVILGYKVTGSVEQPAAIMLKAHDSVTGITYDCSSLEGVNLSEGTHTIKWNAEADGAKFKSDNVVFTMRVIMPTYCVIDISAGPDAEQYPVSYLEDVPKGGWTDEYKTTKLVLRWCPAGKFTSAKFDCGEVTVTKDFFAGVFEVTQKQWLQVMGARPSSASLSVTGDMYPVCGISYNDIRGDSLGTRWPSSSSVDPISFMGKLRSKTKLKELDLPTEAQWERACRADTVTTYNTGDGASALALAGWYSGNANDTNHPVGQKVANAWGLYDMHGNVWELCLDWYGGNFSGTNPKGPVSGSYRSCRGGCWMLPAGYSTSSNRSYCSPSDADGIMGFRLFRTCQ